jgi:hypothetical protein
MNDLDVSKVTRLEVIDENGRSYVKYQISDIEFSLQDDARTLKIFLKVSNEQTNSVYLNTFWNQRMKSLLEYMKHKDGTYVSVDLSADSKVQLDNYLNMTLDPMDRVDSTSYHTTIIYSRTPVPDAEKFKGTPVEGAATAIKWEVFPTKNDGKCLVLKLEFPFAEKLNRTLTDMGATSDYDEYKPHITIAYDFQGDIDPTTMALPQFPLYFDPVKVAPLETDYVSPNKFIDRQ